jgi:uncharacterized protein YbjT (DUF2867 family)
MTIAVTTPTGHVGSRVVRLLVQAGVRPVVLVRDPDRLEPAVRDLVDVAAGDLTDAAYVAEATKGVDALLWVVPEDFTAADPLAEMTRLAGHAAAAVTANGIARVVLVSSVGAEKRHGAGLIDGLARNEEALTGTGSNVLILRNGYYYTNLLGMLDGLQAGVLTTTMPGDVPMAWVDPRDVAEVAAVRLLAADWTGTEVQAVHGPVDLTWAEVTAVVAGATGRDIRLEVISDDDLRAALSAAGMPEPAIEGVVGMTAGVRDGFTPDQPRSALTTTPTTLGAWAYDNLRPVLGE